MPYFTMPYRVLFHDTMAYGTHHFLTNFKFQCVAREHLYFSRIDKDPKAQADNDNLILLTQQAYSRNLSPVGLGEKVAILLSIEEPTLSTVRLCFRVIRHDGVPVSCGFQTIVCLSRQTGLVVPSPPSFFHSEVDVLLIEKLQNPSFVERILAGNLKEIFDNDTISLGVSVANAPPELSFPSIVPESSINETSINKEKIDRVRLERGVIFTFPGQGSYFPGLLKELSDVDGEAYSLFEKADKITRSYLGHPFLPLVTAASILEQDEILKQCPDLVQIAIYLTGVLGARFLIKNGLKPDILVGHSMGEISALAIGGAYSIETGIELVCHRVLALQSLKGDAGGMAALPVTQRRTSAVIEALGTGSLSIAVVNHLKQTVISGSIPDLKRLASLSNHIGISYVPLQSRYPFHSDLLKPVVNNFASRLRRFSFHSTNIPVYSPIGRIIYSSGSDLPEALSSHLVTSFNFDEAINYLYKSGGRTFIECGGGKVLTDLVRKILHDKIGVATHAIMPSQGMVKEGINRTLMSCTEKGLSPDAFHKTPVEQKQPTVQDLPKSIKDIPIAIVSMGCVLPGAFNVNHYWDNIIKGVSGIRDAAEFEAALASDFLSAGKVIPDKTYSLLGGFVRNFEPDISRLPYDAQEFSQLSSAQRFLSVATAECLSNIKSNLPEPAQIQYIIGSTADGFIEYDQAMLFISLQQIVKNLDETAENRESFCRSLEKVLGYSQGDAERLSPYKSIRYVAEKMIGRGIKSIAIDTACSSSLYSIDLGIKSLRNLECDTAFCGGVFAPGPANSCLFSQFKGLSATGSRPFDASADGVVFGEGAAILALKRLPDAIAAGDHIHAVIRGIGLSSDGKSPSVAVPKTEGQVLAIRRAYEQAEVQPTTIQYIEAHATATPVGDAAEFLALSQVFRESSTEHPPIKLGSVKALLGHTGWVAGAASVIKVCNAMKEKIIPPQFNFTSPNPNINLTGSPFTIPTSPQPWSPNISPFPRRAAINGFGFGGTNAHLIMEAYEPLYHKRLCEKLASVK